jgi:hypothetical protein
MIVRQCRKLTVSVGRINNVAVDNGHFTDACSRNEFGSKGANASHTNHHNVFSGERLNSFFSNQ